VKRESGLSPTLFVMGMHVLSISNFGIVIRSHPRPVAGHLAQCVLQGWCATGRALRQIPRLLANKSQI